MEVVTSLLGRVIAVTHVNDHGPLGNVRRGTKAKSPASRPGSDYSAGARP
jgi:hypothetical protein